MAEFETYQIKVCTVCVHLIANGEYNDGTDVGEKCSDGQVAIWGDDTRHMCLAGCDEDCSMANDPVNYPDHECESFEQGFSWSDCKGCGDSDGGDRFLACVMIPR